MHLHGLTPASLRDKIPEFLPGWKPIFAAVQCAMCPASGGAPPGSLSRFLSAPEDAAYGVTGVPGLGVGLRFANPTCAVTSLMPAFFTKTVHLIRLSELPDQVLPFALAAYLREHGQALRVWGVGLRFVIPAHELSVQPESNVVGPGRFQGNGAR